MSKPEILFMKQEDVIAAGVLDMKEILTDAENTFKLWADGDIKNMMKVSMILPDAEHERAFFNSMPAYVGGTQNVAGIKWAAESRENIANPKMPTGVDITILSDPHTALPVCILDGTIITAMRTSASAGVAAKYLARKDTKKACFVGSGIIGRTMVLAMREALPQLEDIMLYDLDHEKSAALAAEYAGDGAKAKVRSVDELEPAVREADLIVTMTSTRTPFLREEWLRKNAMVIQMGPNELLPEVITGADRLVTDSFEELINIEISAIGKLYHKGMLHEGDATDLKEIVAGRAAGRASDEERIVYCSLGIGAMDMVISERLYRKAQELSLGTKVVLWDKPLWI